MRILFTVSSLEGGGAERVAALLSNAWVARGHEVVLVPTFSGRGGCYYPLDERVKLVFLADLVTSRFARSGAGRLLALRHLVAQRKPDVVVSFLPNVNVAAILASGPVPVIVSERIYPPLLPLPVSWRALRRLAYPRADRVVMQTVQGLRWLEGTIPAARGAIIRNPLSYPLPNRAPAIKLPALTESGRLLLAVGRLDPQKNFGLLIEAFARVAAEFPDWHLAIIGDGSERLILEGMVIDGKLTGRVSLPGRAGNSGEWFDRADAFAMTSRFEGSPNALIEALAYGLPSLSLDCPTGPSELIVDGINGLLLPAAAGAGEVANGLRTLLSGAWPGAAAGAEAIRHTFDLDLVADQWLALFEEVGER